MNAVHGSINTIADALLCTFKQFDIHYQV